MKNKNTKFIIIGLIIAIIIGLAFYIAKTNKKGEHSGTNYYLDTVNQITLIDVTESKAKKILPEVDKIILGIHNAMSMQMNSSELSKINQNAGIKPVKVSEDTFNVVKKAVYYSGIIGNTFDVTVGPLSSLWNIGNEKAKVPTKTSIDSAIGLINYKDIVLNEKDHTIFLKRKGMKMDLGGIAKGYCADKVYEYLKENGVDNAIINLGGNIFVMGQNSKKKDFVVGIQDPSIKGSDPMASIQTTNMSIVTSGIYERFIEQDGKLYHHMLDPKTGYPFDNNLSSVTIISPKSIDGDALSTSLFGLGLEAGLKKAEELKDVEAVFITKDSKVYVSSGLKNKISILNDKYSFGN